MHEEIVSFFRTGGRLEIVCSPEMAAEDIEALRASVATVDEGIPPDFLSAGMRESFLNELEEMAAAANGALHLSLLGGMILHQLAEFKIAVPLSGSGIYHEKRGIAVDEIGQTVAFFGSANETMAGWGKDGNVEAIDVFRSWLPQDRERTDDHIEKFDQVWQGRRKGVMVKSLPEAVKERLLRAAPSDQDEFYRTLKAYQRLRGLKVEDEPTCDPLSEIIAPPAQRHLDTNQTAALRAWIDAGCRGLLKLATGAGKTLTALRGVRLHTNDGLPALILVPSKLLLRQWKSEIMAELPDSIVMLAGDSHVKWNLPGRVEAFLSPNTTGERRIILATMQTASSERFRSLLKKHLVQNLLLVADEVHQMGSIENQKLFKVQAGKRLGLSATPERFGDPEGTSLLMDYFGGIVGPIVTLSDAIRSGRLVPYRYFPHFATLSETEREQWIEISLRIRKAYSRAPRDGGGRPVENEYIRLLKIQRSWIPKKASQKVKITQRILRDHFENGQHWLVYCENQEQIKEISDACLSMGVNALTYHTAMGGDAETTLNYFISYGGILLSIRCLDEGVDIPVISHAIILASSQNPRQFIQRRGRVLRAHPNKAIAEIHDILVIPSNIDDADQDSLTISEFTRAIEFAKDSINQAEASLLREKAIDLGLSLTEIYDTGQEVAQLDAD
jgi:superfamily II DNA or RNA helicase